MRLLVVAGGFPSLSETFIFHKVVALARSGIEVEVMARRRGDAHAYAREMAQLPSTLTVNFLPPTQPEALAAARLPVMLSQALLRHPAETRAWMRHAGERCAGGGELARKLYRLLPFVGKRPDVTHLEFATMAEEFGELIPLLPGRKVISCRGADIDILPRSRPSLAAAIGKALQQADAVHCVSSAMVRSAGKYGLDPARAFVNHPSIDWRYFHPEEPPASRLRRDRFTVVTVARLHWKKGLQDALRAIARMHALGTPTHYVVVGEGDAREAIQFDIWDHGLADHVTLAGALPRDSVRSLLAEADAFLLPSISEGLSNAALEAMAMRLPVVTTDAGGMAEAVRDGRDGFVVARRDADAMADRLLRLARDPDLRRRLGETARERVRDRFAIETQVRIFSEVYQALAAGRSLPAGTQSCELT
jgi:colanic acid/amylovoran biosynthesis glycosyltransferase